MRKSLAVLTIVILLIVFFAAAYFIWRNPSAEEGSITVTDALGSTVQIKTPVTKVMVVGKNSWPIITVAYMFPSAKNLLYAISSNMNVSLFRMVDPKISSKIVTIPIDDLSAEELAKMKPDVVILKSTMKELGDSLEALKIEVVYVDFETLETYIRDIKVLGKIFMDEMKAEEIANYYNETYYSILSQIPSEGKREKVLFLYYNTKGGTISFQVPGQGWLQTFMIETAGGYPLSKELFGTGWNTVSFEQIANWNPDIIFLVTYSRSPAANEVKNWILNNDNWKDISAVKNGKVYAVPHDCENVAALGSWDCPGSRWIIGLKWMAKKIHPAIFENLDITREAKMFYMEMYGLDEDDANTIVNQISGDL
ncbi:MAG: ABC transporter substrate-binding protein [Candidatus Jordarchaeaceae archaeon]